MKTATPTQQERLKAVCKPYKILGKDHYSMLLYVQYICGNYDGQPFKHNSALHVRSKHRTFGDMGQPLTKKNGTRLWTGEVLDDHDDFDCAEDLEKLGLMTNSGTVYVNPCYRMTPLGHEVCGKLIDAKQGVR